MHPLLRKSTIYSFVTNSQSPYQNNNNQQLFIHTSQNHRGNLQYIHTCTTHKRRSKITVIKNSKRTFPSAAIFELYHYVSLLC